MVPVTAAMLKQENGGEDANWFSLIPARRVTSTQGMTVPETGNPLLALLYSL
jgi:hypothetical protein